MAAETGTTLTLSDLSDLPKLHGDAFCIGQGTGLGLAIAPGLARAMGGEVGVESELGEGTWFRLRLPLEIAARQGVKAADTGNQADQKSDLDVQVVEDNATNRIVLQEMLLQHGHRVLMAEDGGIGMEMARSHPFDVILMEGSVDGRSDHRRDRTFAGRRADGRPPRRRRSLCHGRHRRAAQALC